MKDFLLGLFVGGAMVTFLAVLTCKPPVMPNWEEKTPIKGWSAVRLMMLLSLLWPILWMMVLYVKTHGGIYRTTKSDK